MFGFRKSLVLVLVLALALGFPRVMVCSVVKKSRRFGIGEWGEYRLDVVGPTMIFVTSTPGYANCQSFIDLSLFGFPCLDNGIILIRILINIKNVVTVSRKDLLRFNINRKNLSILRNPKIIIIIKVTKINEFSTAPIEQNKT